MNDKIRCKWADTTPELKNYHDFEYGFKINDDILYFERLILELFQAGLSWSTILKKRNAFRLAFDNFDFNKISKYDDSKISELLENPGIIRNKLKINATIYNAKQFIQIIDKYKSFNNFLNSLTIENHDEIIKIFRKTFKFMGPLIVEEFMMSTGFWKVKHEENCFLFK